MATTKPTTTEAPSNWLRNGIALVAFAFTAAIFAASINVDRKILMDICWRVVPVCATLLGFVLTNLNIGLSQINNEKFALLRQYQPQLARKLFQCFQAALTALGGTMIYCGVILAGLVPEIPWSPTMTAHREVFYRFLTVGIVWAIALCLHRLIRVYQMLNGIVDLLATHIGEDARPTVPPTPPELLQPFDK